MNIVTRFAPSPTGFIHIGNIRIALFSWLFARKYNGKFILRIEDTDIKRSNKIYIKDTLKCLKWLNLNWDEKIHYQSKRYIRYKQILNILLKKKLAYKCYCSKKRLNELKINQINNKLKPKYDKYCLLNSIDNFNKKYVIRFNNPINTNIKFFDHLRGYIIINNNELDDLIICRSDGTFTYNFCCVIDDYDMKISHIIRGEEHINNTPRQINLLKAIDNNYKIPIYVHLPLILDINKKKISKRFKNISNIYYYKKLGYLPISIINYILKLGWSYHNKEIFSYKEMLKFFNLKKINKSPCIFDINKLNWYNKYYLRNTSNNSIILLLKKFLIKNNYLYNKKLNFKKLIFILKNRCYCFNNMYYNYNYLFNKYLILNINIINNILNIINNKSKIIIIYYFFKNTSICYQQDLEILIQKLSKKINIKKEVLFRFLQLILTGIINTPNIFSIIMILGYKNILLRIKNILYFI